MNLKNKLTNKKIAVLCGGFSRERKISLESGQAVYNALKDAGYTVNIIDVGENFINDITNAKPDLVFIAMHGTFGEDGTLQSVLENLKIPYCGSPPSASLLAMDKVAAKMIFLNSEIPTPNFFVVPPDSTLNSLKNKIDNFVPFPWVAKPVSDGSSVGVKIIHKLEDFSEYLKSPEGQKAVLAEEFIPGRELSVGILDNEYLPIIELKTERDFYDFDAKYIDSDTQFIVNPELDSSISQSIQEMAIKAHKALGCRDFSRVDFRLNNNGNYYVLEVNTIPGLTSHSLLPLGAKNYGLDFLSLIEKVLSLALQRSK